MLESQLTKCNGCLLILYISMENFEKLIFSAWSEESSILTTRLSGMVVEDDVKFWIDGFNEAYKKIPKNSSIKLYSNLYGFKAENIKAHKMMREIIPQFLADHGMYPGYAKLFPEIPVDVTIKDEIVCVKCAHVHHDETKITRYQAELSKENENYFIEPTAALTWLLV